MRFAQFRGGLIVLCKILISFVCEIFQGSGATTCIYWLSCQSSMQCKIQNNFVKLRKFLNAENFSATAVAQAPVQKKYDRKEFLHFLICLEKIS